MKKIYGYMLAAAGLMALATSCSSDEPAVVATDGTTEVSFRVQAPGNVSSRTVGDGYSACDLYMSIYNDNTWVRDSVIKNAFDGTTHETTVSIRFVNGKTYKVAFWAQNMNAPYTFEKGQVKIDYTSQDPVANNDIYDAFCNIDPEPFTVTATTGMQTVELKRPFAQVNFGANDYVDAINGGVTVTKSAMEFSADAYTSLNVLDGSVDGKQAVTFTSAGLPDCESIGDAPAVLVAGGKNYSHVGMAYILVAADKATVATVKHIYNDGEGEVAVTQVPVQRNYRTNIVGTLYTTAVPIYVIINEEFDGEYVKAIDVRDMSDIASLIDASYDYQGKVVELNFLADIDMTGYSWGIANGDIVFNLNNKTLTIDNLQAGAEGSFQIYNGKVVIPGAGSICVYNNGDVIIDNVEITAAESAVNLSGGIAAFTGNVVIRNSTINSNYFGVSSNASQLAQNTGNLELENVVITGNNYAGICLNVPITCFLTNVKATGTEHGAFLRGGDYAIIDCEFILDTNGYTASDVEAAAQKYLNANWKSGNEAPKAALTMGNRSTTYQYPTIVDMSGTACNVTGTYADKFRSVYAYANQGTDLGVTFDYDNCTFSHDIVYGSSNITVNGVAQ